MLTTSNSIFKKFVYASKPERSWPLFSATRPAKSFALLEDNLGFVYIPTDPLQNPKPPEHFYIPLTYNFLEI